MKIIKFLLCLGVFSIAATIIEHEIKPYTGAELAQMSYLVDIVGVFYAMNKFIL